MSADTCAACAARDFSSKHLPRHGLFAIKNGGGTFLITDRSGELLGWLHGHDVPRWLRAGHPPIREWREREYPRPAA